MHLPTAGAEHGFPPQPPGSLWWRPVQIASLIGVPAWAAVGAVMVVTSGKVIAVTTPMRIKSRREICGSPAGLENFCRNRFDFSN